MKGHSHVNVLYPPGQMRIVVFLCVSVLRCLLNVGDFLLCCFCWLNRTANQTCFSPLSLFFHFATERGRCLKCSLKETCLLQIIVQKWSKTGRNVSSEAFRTLHSSFRSNLCYFHGSLFTVCQSFHNMIVCKLRTNYQYLF